MIQQGEMPGATTVSPDTVAQLTPAPQTLAEAGRFSGWRERFVTAVAAGAAAALVLQPMPERAPAHETAESVSAKPDALQRAATAGPLPLGVVIVRAEGDKTPGLGYTKDLAMGYTANAESQIAEATNGIVRFATPKFYGNYVLKVSHPELACATYENQIPLKEFEDNIVAAAGKAATDAGYVAKQNAGLMVYVDEACPNPPRSNTLGVMFSENNNIYIAEDPASGRPFLAHELGHLLGLSHANEFICSKTGQVNIVTPDCTTAEYGDPRSIMGPAYQIEGVNDQVTFNGYELLHLGALKRDEVQAITKYGTYDLNLTALEATTPGTKLVRVPRSGKSPDGGTFLSYYWIELSRGPKQSENPGCKTQKGAVPICTYPQPLSVAVYAANETTGKVASPTELAIIEPLGHPGAGGATNAESGQIILQDPVTGLLLRLNQIDEAQDNAQLTLQFQGGK